MKRAEFVIVDTRFELIGPGCGVNTTLSYTSREPFTVCVAFLVGPNTTIEWVMSRELLESGLEDRAGDGDVVLCPMSSRPGLIEVLVRSPNGQAIFAAPAATLRGFLDDSYRVLPRGSEIDDADVDAELATILADSAPTAASDLISLPTLVPPGPDEVWLGNPLVALDLEYDVARCRCAECECNASIGGFPTWEDPRADDEGDQGLCSLCRRHRDDEVRRA